LPSDACTTQLAVLSCDCRSGDSGGNAWTSTKEATRGTSSEGSSPREIGTWCDPKTLAANRPELLQLKADLLASAEPTPASGRRTVAVDPAGGGWPDALLRAAYQPDLPSAWLLEGVLVYLERAGAERLLGQAAVAAAAGSRLGADFVAEDLVNSPWMRSHLERLEAQGAPWRWGQVVVTQPGEPGAGQGRWPWPVVPRSVPGVPRSFLVTAAKR
jgi:hypothetical protein